MSVASFANDVCVYTGEVDGPCRLYRVQRAANNLWDLTRSVVVHDAKLGSERIDFQVVYSPTHGGNLALILHDSRLYVVTLDSGQIVALDDASKAVRPSPQVCGDRLFYAASTEYEPNKVMVCALDNLRAPLYIHRMEGYNVVLRQSEGIVGALSSTYTILYLLTLNAIGERIAEQRINTSSIYTLPTFYHPWQLRGNLLLIVEGRSFRWIDIKSGQCLGWMALPIQIDVRVGESCVYACACMCARVCLCVGVYVCLCVCAYVGMYVYCACMCACMCIVCVCG